MFLSAWFYPNKKSKEFYFNVTAIVLIVIALLITLIVEVPIVDQIKEWKVTTIPNDSETIRNRWVFLHGLRTFAALASFGCFSAAILKTFQK